EEEIREYETIIGIKTATNIDKTRAFLRWGHVLGRLEKWEESISKIRAALSESDRKALQDAGALWFTAEFIKGIAKSTEREEAWNRIIPKLVEVYLKQDALGLLGAGLAHSLAGLPNALLSADGLRMWRKIWAESASKHEHLQVG